MTNTDMHCIYRNSSGLVLQVVFLERYVLESKQFSSVFHFHCFQMPVFNGVLQVKQG